MNSASQLAHVPTWQREKALALQDICEQVAADVSIGSTQYAAVQLACSQNAGRLLHGDKGKTKTLRLAAKTLTNHFKKWMDAGKVVTVFIPNYKPGRRKIPGELIGEFHRLSSLSGVSNMSVALNTLKRLWRAGKPVEGLGTWQEWWAQERSKWPLPEQAPDFPFTDSAMYRHRPPRAEVTMGTKGIAAAKTELPWMTRTSKDLRPGEVYTFDDVRLDMLAIDDQTKRPTELQAYIAYEVGCRMIPAFVVRPANAMLKTDVDSLVVRSLKTFGVGRDYTTHLYFERGTLTMSPAAKDFLERVTDGRIKVHYTSMNSGRSIVGANRDAGVGHWMGKGMIESLMRKIHLALMMLPGQRGNSYANQPRSLGWNGQGQKSTPGTLAREAEDLLDIEQWTGERRKLNLGLMWTSDVTLLLRQAIKLHNADRGHNYEGFGTVTQTETAPGVWEDALCN